MKISLLFAGAAALLMGATGASANIVVNGSFEGQASGYDLLGGGSGAISGWTTTGEGVEWFKPLPYGFGPAKDGESAIDLAWYTSSGTPGGGITQTLATTAGQSYTLSYWGTNIAYAGRDGTGLVDTYIDNALIDSSNLVRTLGTAWTASDWVEYSFSFTAASSATTLEFRNQQNAYLHFATIDGVSVVAASGAVPEPASWAMMVGGLGLVGGFMRRRPAILRHA